MATQHAHPGVPVDLRPAGESLTETRSNALVKDKTFEAIRLVIPAGHVLAQHQVEGAITIYCLDGRITFTVGDETHELKAGQWLFLRGGEPHSLSGIEDSAVLLTIIFP